MFRAIPFLAIIVIAYNVIALVATGPALRAAVMAATLSSEAAWTLTAGDLLVLAGVCLLFLEIVKARRSWRAGGQPPATAAVLIALALLVGMAPPASAQRSGADLPADAKQRLETLLEELGTPAAAPLPEGAKFLVRFRGDVDGLKPGAAVRIRGFRIGTVRDVRVTFDSATNALDVPVVIDVVPDLLVVDGTTSRSDAAVRKAVATLVERGLRAQLRGGVLGNTHVALDLIEGAEPATLRMGGDYPEIPAGPARGEQMTKAAEALLASLCPAPPVPGVIRPPGGRRRPPPLQRPPGMSSGRKPRRGRRGLLGSRERVTSSYLPSRSTRRPYSGSGCCSAIRRMS